MNAAPDYALQLWGPLQLGHEISLRALAIGSRTELAMTNVKGVIAEMDVRAFGANKPSSLLLVPRSEYLSLASDYVDAAPRYFASACADVGRRFASSKLDLSLGDGRAIFYHSDGATMFHDAGVPLPFHSQEHEARARSLRPGVITKYRHSPSVLRDAYVKSARVYPATMPDGQIGMKTELKLNCRRGPNVARDEAPPFKHLVYS